jgi:hypothetical protein
MAKNRRRFDNGKHTFDQHMKTKPGIDHQALEVLRDPGSCPKKLDPTTWELMQLWGCTPPKVEMPKKPKGPSPEMAQQEALARKQAFVETAMGKETRRQEKMKVKAEKAKLKQGNELLKQGQLEAETERRAEAKRLRWKAQKSKDRQAKNLLHAKANEMATQTGIIQGKQSNMDALARAAARLLEEQR